MDKRIIVFTIAARNYLSLASVLLESIRAHCGEVDFRCFVVDGYDGDMEIPASLRGFTVDCRGMGIPRFEEMAFKYDVIEFSTALKPFIFRDLLQIQGYDRVVFLDPDIKLYEDLRWVEALLDSRSIVVTPHLLDVARNDPSSTSANSTYELTNFLFAGDFNLGFIAIRNDPQAIAFVSWWASVLATQCFFERDQGLCVDQKWVNLATGFLGDQLAIVRDPGANVAFWNLHERRMTRDLEGRCRVNGSLLKFIHYSNLDLNEQALANAIIAGGRVDTTVHAVFSELYFMYAKEALEAGHRERRRDVSYRFDFFEDGSPVNRLHRRLFAARVAHGEIPSPFAKAGAYYSLLERKRLLDPTFRTGFARSADVENLTRKRRIVEAMFRLLFRVLGTKRYLALLLELRRIAVLQNNTFLLK
jgi:hypothetical protein